MTHCPDCGSTRMPWRVERYGSRCIRCWVWWMQWTWPEDWRERLSSGGTARART